MKHAARLLFLILAAVLALPLSAAELTLEWSDNSSDEAAFAIERAEGAEGEFAEVARVAADVITYTDSDLKPATVYRYRVRAGNAAGWSGYSNTAEAMTHPPAPAAPGDLGASAPPPIVVTIPPGGRVLVTAGQ